LDQVYGDEFISCLPELFGKWLSWKYSYYNEEKLTIEEKEEVFSNIGLEGETIFLTNIASQILLCILGILTSPRTRDLSLPLREHIQCQKELGKEAIRDNVGLKCNRIISLAAPSSNFARQVPDPFHGQCKNGAWKPKNKI